MRSKATDNGCVCSPAVVSGAASVDSLVAAGDVIVGGTLIVAGTNVMDAIANAGGGG